MPIKTLIIGHVPLTDTVDKKPRQIREDVYMKELLAQFDLGEVHYTLFETWKAKADEINPLFIILLGNDYYGQEVHDYKKDALLYVSHSPSQIFYRKAEIEERKAEQHKTFSEIAGFVQKAKEGGDEEMQSMRRFTAMSYEEMYEMIKKGILSKDKDLHDKAWDLLFGNGERHSSIVWMRMQFLAETWERADGKGKEELMCMAMDQYVHEGMARKLDIFTDLDGQQYHQYMFCTFNGQDINYIRRIPFGEKGQEKYAYEALLAHNETPANYLRIMVEVGEMRKQQDEYFKTESAKVAKVLTAWKADPTKSKRELGVIPWSKEYSNEDPLTDRELTSLKNFLHKHDKTAYESIFNDH